MLVGREDECARIDRLLAQARSGRSGGLVVLGEAGIGKSALLEYAAAQADGMTVARALGVESEAELEFSGLLEVCRPLLDRLPELPERQAAALSGALGLGPAERAERFAVAAATMTLLAAAAEDSPLLVLVDDAHWLDRSSAEALVFALRRLQADPVAVVFAVREDEGASFSAPGVEVMEVSGLDPDAVAKLLAAASDSSLAPELPDRLHAATRGNPLALLELLSLLTPEQLRGAAPLEEPLPAGAAVERAFTRRAAELPDDAHRALVVAAVNASTDLEPVTSALQRIGLDGDSLEPAEDAGLVRIDSGRLVFRHPLVRSAVFHAARPSERREAHRALAEALAGRSRDEELAWHLAAAAIGPDEDAAGALAAVARGASQRGRDAAAAAAFEQAARLSTDDRLRVERLADATRAAFASGDYPRAVALADEVVAASDDRALHAQLLSLRARAEFSIGSAAEATKLLVQAAGLLEEDDPDTAVESLAYAASFAVHVGDIPLALVVAQRARALAPSDGSSIDQLADRAMGEALTFAGSGDGNRFHERAVELARGTESAVQLHAAAIALTLLDRVGEGHELAAEAARRARESGPGMLARTLEPGAWSDLRAGRWQRAVLAASEGLALARDVGFASLEAAMSAILAQIEAARGDEMGTRAHAEQALAFCDRHDLRLIEQWARYSLALLELGLGRFDVAAGLLTSVADRMAEMQLFYRDISPEPDLVELNARLGQPDEAQVWLTRWSERTANSGSAWAAAVDARCRGIVADEDGFRRHFEDALEHHAVAEDRFAEARTRLCFGERLRRAGARVEAREQLRAALALLEELGAQPWAERARGELRATGETLRRREPHEGEELTPQELQIALQVAEGKTNKEVGAALFLSPRTIEFHLKRVYRKLNVRSRAELIRKFAASPPSA